MKKVVIGIGAIIVILSLGFIFHHFGPSRSLQKYEWFKNQYAQIQQVGKQIENTNSRIQEFKNFNGDPKKWDWSLKEEFSRIQTVLQGYTEQYNYMVAEYNAQSSKFNWSGFKTSLPRDAGEYK
jgi:uncharacterized protein YxeA